MHFILELEKLVYEQKFDNRLEAMVLERYLKSFKNKPQEAKDEIDRRKNGRRRAYRNNNSRGKQISPI